MENKHISTNSKLTAEQRAEHHDPKRRISPAWAAVMAAPANRHLQQLIYRCDKDDARHS